MEEREGRMMTGIDPLTEVIFALARYDAVRCKEEHMRITNLQGVEGPFGTAIRIKIRHRKPDGSTKTVGAQYVITPLMRNLSMDIFDTMEEGHKMLDGWAYEGVGILAMEEQTENIS